MCPRSPGRLTPGTGHQLACGIHSDCRSRLSIKPVYVGVLFYFSQSKGRCQANHHWRNWLVREKLQAN